MTERICHKCHKEIDDKSNHQTIFEGKEWCECEITKRRDVKRMTTSFVKKLNASILEAYFIV